MSDDAFLLMNFRYAARERLSIREYEFTSDDSDGKYLQPISEQASDDEEFEETASEDEEDLLAYKSCDAFSLGRTVQEADGEHLSLLSSDTSGNPLLISLFRDLMATFRRGIYVCTFNLMYTFHFHGATLRWWAFKRYDHYAQR